MKETASEMNVDFEIVKYGALVELSSLLDISAALLISLILGRFLQSLLFISVFSFLRVYCGGYHCKTVVTCGCMYLVIVLSGVMFYSQLNSTAGLLVSFLCVIYLWTVCPVEHENNPLSQKEYRRSSFIVKIRLFIVMSLCLFLAINHSPYQGIITTVQIWLTILCFIQNRKEKKCYEKNSTDNCCQNHG